MQIKQTVMVCSVVSFSRRKELMTEYISERDLLDWLTWQRLGHPKRTVCLLEMLRNCLWELSMMLRKSMSLDISLILIWYAKGTKDSWGVHGSSTHLERLKILGCNVTEGWWRQQQHQHRGNHHRRVTNYTCVAAASTVHWGKVFSTFSSSSQSQQGGEALHSFWFQVCWPPRLTFTILWSIL